MNSLKNIYSQIQYLICELEVVSENLENKKDDMDDLINDLDGSITAKVQENYDYIKNKIYHVDCCIKNLELAKESLANYS